MPPHCRRPPQSPVVQLPCLPDLSKLQPLRAQKRPDHPVGATTLVVSFGLSCRPPLISRGCPTLDWVPGHIVSLHLFCSVKTAALDPEIENEKEKKFSHVCRMEIRRCGEGKTTCEEWEK